jgi:hypothetical protein
MNKERSTYLSTEVRVIDCLTDDGQNPFCHLEVLNALSCHTIMIIYFLLARR